MGILLVPPTGSRTVKKEDTRTILDDTKTTVLKKNGYY